MDPTLKHRVKLYTWLSNITQGTAYAVLHGRQKEKHLIEATRHAEAMIDFIDEARHEGIAKLVPAAFQKENLRLMVQAHRAGEGVRNQICRHDTSPYITTQTIYKLEDQGNIKLPTIVSSEMWHPNDDAPQMTIIRGLYHTEALNPLKFYSFLKPVTKSEQLNSFLSRQDFLETVFFPEILIKRKVQPTFTIYPDGFRCTQTHSGRTTDIKQYKFLGTVEIANKERFIYGHNGNRQSSTRESVPLADPACEVG
jgi:hypothetical protein